MSCSTVLMDADGRFYALKTTYNKFRGPFLSFSIFTNVFCGLWQCYNVTIFVSPQDVVSQLTDSLFVCPETSYNHHRDITGEFTEVILVRFGLSSQDM